MLTTLGPMRYEASLCHSILALGRCVLPQEHIWMWSHAWKEQVMLYIFIYIDVYVLWLQMYVHDLLRTCVRIEIDTDKIASFLLCENDVCLVHRRRVPIQSSQRKQLGFRGFGLGGSHAAKRTYVDPETPSFCYAFISGKEYVSIHSKDVFFSLNLVIWHPQSWIWVQVVYILDEISIAYARKP